MYIYTYIHVFFDITINDMLNMIIHDMCIYRYISLFTYIFIVMKLNNCYKHAPCQTYDGPTTDGEWTERLATTMGATTEESGLNHEHIAPPTSSARHIGVLLRFSYLISHTHNVTISYSHIL